VDATGDPFNERAPRAKPTPVRFQDASRGRPRRPFGREGYDEPLRSQAWHGRWAWPWQRRQEWSEGLAHHVTGGEDRLRWTARSDLSFDGQMTSDRYLRRALPAVPMASSQCARMRERLCICAQCQGETEQDARNARTAWIFAHNSCATHGAWEAWGL